MLTRQEYDVLRRRLGKQPATKSLDHPRKSRQENPNESVRSFFDRVVLIAKSLVFLTVISRCVELRQETYPHPRPLILLNGP